MSSSFRSAKKDGDDVESLVGTTKYAGGAGLQKWDKAVLVDLGTGEQPWLKEVYMGELQTPTTDEEAKVTYGEEDLAAAPAARNDEAPDDAEGFQEAGDAGGCYCTR